MKTLSSVLSAVLMSALVASPAMAADKTPTTLETQQNAVALADGYTLQGMLQMAYGDRTFNLLRYLGNQPAGAYGMLMDTHIVSGKKHEKVVTFVPAAVVGANFDMGNLLQVGFYANFGIINGTYCDACENATPAVPGGAAAKGRHQSFTDFGAGLFVQKSIYNHFIRANMEVQYISYAGNEGLNGNFAAARYLPGNPKSQSLHTVPGDQSGVNFILTVQGGRTVPVNNWYLLTPVLQYQLDTLSLSKNGRITLNRVGLDANNTFLVRDNLLFSAGLGVDYQWASTPSAQSIDSSNYKPFAFTQSISGHLPAATSAVHLDLNATWRINPQWTLKLNAGWKHYFAATATSSNYALGVSYLY